MQCREQSGWNCTRKMLSHIPPRTADKLYACEFFEEKLGVRIAYGYAILTQLTKIEKSGIFNLLL